MIEIFKNWVSTMLCLGIFMTFIQLIIPKTNLKKYIYSLVGVITIITVISPVVNILKNKDVEESLSEAIASMSSIDNETYVDEEKYTEKRDNNLRETFALNMKNDIKLKVEEKGIECKTIDMFLTEQYNVEKLKICIGKIDEEKTSLADVTEVVKYINSEYDLDFSKIEVIED